MIRPLWRVYMYVQLAERLYGRVSLVFLFDLGGQHAQLSDVASWMRALESHSTFLSAVYGPAFAAAVSSPQHWEQQQVLCSFGAKGSTAPELASISYVCVDHAPAWLRPLAIRSMRRLAPSFYPLSPFHEFPHRLRLAGQPTKDPPGSFKQESEDGALRRLAKDYNRLCSLIGSQATARALVGSFLGYSGRWGAAETEAMKRRERDKFVTVLLVDRSARVRWHATGLPTEEAVLLLL